MPNGLRSNRGKTPGTLVPHAGPSVRKTESFRGYFIPAIPLAPDSARGFAPVTLRSQLSDDQDAYWRFVRIRQFVEGYYQPTPPVDQSAAIFHQPTQPTTQSNMIPTAIADCWHLLKQSQLSEETFRRLVSAASSRTPRSGAGLGPLDAKSLATILHFWNAVRATAAEPEIAISPKGNIQAEWTKDIDNFLVLEFQPNGEIFFSLWQGNYPTEGVKSAALTHELINMFDAMDENPLGWSDAA